MSCARRGLVALGCAAVVSGARGDLALANVAPHPTMPAAASTRRDSLAATRALIAALSRNGHGEALLTLTSDDALANAPVVQRGTLAIEVPDRVRIDFGAQGERITVRGDGGEWIQPQARQLLRLKPEQASSAGALWSVLLEGGGRWFDEHEVAPHRFVLTPRRVAAADRAAAAIADSIWVTVAADGLPRELGYRDPEGVRMRYGFTRWRFSRSRGRAAFVLATPPGYAEVALP